MDFLENCLKIISIDSSPSAGNFEVAQFAAELARRAGFLVEVFEEIHQGLRQANVVVALPGENENCLLLQTHLDTVEPAQFSLWTKTGANPFEATLYDNKIYGLGSADVKLDFLCKLEALKKIRESKLKKPVVLVGTFGEESGMVGIIRLMRRRTIKPSHAFIGEATGLKLVRAGKGIAMVEVNIPFSEQEMKLRSHHDQQESSSAKSRMFSGLSGHSSTAPQGQNAIRKLLDHLGELSAATILLQLEGGINFNTVPENAFLEIAGTSENFRIDSSQELENSEYKVSGNSDALEKAPKHLPMKNKLMRLKNAFENLEMKFQLFPDPLFDVPEATLNIGKVWTEESSVVFQACVRIPPNIKETTYSDWLNLFKSECEDVGAKFTIQDFKRPFVTPLDASIVSVAQGAAKSIDLSIELGQKSVTNEGNILSRLGVECLAFGPGESENNVHTPHEHVDVQSLYKAIEFYHQVIIRMCL